MNSTTYDVQYRQRSSVSERKKKKRKRIIYLRTLRNQFSRKRTLAQEDLVLRLRFMFSIYVFARKREETFRSHRQFANTHHKTRCTNMSQRAATQRFPSNSLRFLVPTISHRHRWTSACVRFAFAGINLTRGKLFSLFLSLSFPLSSSSFISSAAGENFVEWRTGRKHRSQESRKEVTDNVSSTLFISPVSVIFRSRRKRKRATDQTVLPA